MLVSRWSLFRRTALRRSAPAAEHGFQRRFRSGSIVVPPAAWCSTATSTCLGRQVCYCPTKPLLEQAAQAIRGFLGERVVDENPGARLGTGQVFELPAVAEDRIELDVQVRLRGRLRR